MPVTPSRSPKAKAPEHAARPRGADTLALRVVDSPSARLVDRLVEIEGPLVVGREPGPSGLAVDDSKMSSRHCTIEVDALGQLAFRDEKSKNGSFVRGVRSPHGTLADGDVLRLGATLFVATRRGPDGPLEDPGHGLVGLSPAFRTMCAQAIAAAAGPDPLALLGDHGVEVDAVARLVHRRGRGADGGPFVVVDCAALRPDRLDAELFGPTGKARAAHGGTLLLDEVDALDAAAQAALLGLIERRALPAGAGKRGAPIDVRIVAAVYPELAPAVTSGAFDAALYARLAATRVVMPPLVDRREDILRLVRHEAGVAPGQPLLDGEAAEQLLTYAWPANRREVHQLVMRIAGKRRPLRQADLPKTVVPGAPPLAPAEPIVNNPALRKRKHQVT
ncbi:MAG: sigma 54-interacting transcriptional regulator [Deltaproteobacteria bacterium]|nr:sigma 54-interacting transcriptional regulator [Deltaproteobacteria bacterium]